MQEPNQLGPQSPRSLRVACPKSTPFFVACIVFAIVVRWQCPAAANEYWAESESDVDATRTFTNKHGLTVEARVLSVGGSFRTVSVETRDGRRFEIKIVSLSLDDQQFLKEWLLEQPTPDPALLNLELRSETVVEEVERQPFEDRILGGSGTRSLLAYRISVVNKTRQPLVGLRLEYALLWHDLVWIPLPESGNDEAEALHWRQRDQGPVLYRSGAVDIEALKYNTATEALTASVSFHTIQGNSSRTSAEDVAIGVLARLVAKDGTVLAEYSDIDRHYPNLTWTEYEAYRSDNTSKGGFGRLVEKIAAR